MKEVALLFSYMGSFENILTIHFFVDDDNMHAKVFLQNLYNE